MKTYLSALIFASLMLSNTTLAKNAAEEASQKSLHAVTIFIDVNKFTRRTLAAKKMTESHNEFAAHGFELIGVSPYTENGDLEGFFVSYKKQ